MKKLIIFEIILIIFFVLVWNVSKTEVVINVTDLLDGNKEKRKAWIAECYLDARKKSEIVSDLDAKLVNQHCYTLGYEKYPKQ